MTNSRSLRLHFTAASLVLFCLPLPAQAWELDYGLGAGARSYPVGASVFADLGYNQLLWGEHKPGSVLYGFVRPVANLRLSGVVDRGELRVEVNPISFVTLSGGYARSFRFTDTTSVDCSVYACHGNVGGPFAEGALLMGYGPVALGLIARASSVNASGIDGDPRDPANVHDVYDETTALIQQRAGDNLVSARVFAVWRFSPAWKAGFLYEQSRMTVYGSSNDHESVFANYGWDAWSVIAGAGTYASSVQSRGPTFYALVRWVGLPSFGLR